MAKKKKDDVDLMDMGESVQPQIDTPQEDVAPYKDVLIRVIKDIGHAPTCRSRNHEDESKCDCYLADARKLLQNA